MNKVLCFLYSVIFAFAVGCTSSTSSDDEEIEVPEVEKSSSSNTVDAKNSCSLNEKKEKSSSSKENSKEPASSSSMNSLKSSSSVKSLNNSSSSSSNNSSSDSSNSSSSNFSSDSSENTEVELMVASAIAHHCLSDSAVVDSLMDVYKKKGNFGKANTKLADCAYKMTLDIMVGDVVLPLDLYRYYEKEVYEIPGFYSAFFGFWQDVFGTGICDEDSVNVVKRNQDSLSESPKYFICTGKREGFEANLNWISATPLQVNTYGMECDSNDYRGITGKTDSALYVCDHGKWRSPIDVEKEYGLCETAKFGEVKQGNVFEFICDANEWKRNETTLKDSRDEKEYLTTKVAGLNWMMENFKADTAKFTWDEIAAQDFCPSGWRIPTWDEWTSLFTAMQGLSANASTMNLITYAGAFNSWWTANETNSDKAIVASTRYAPMDYAGSKKFDNYGTGDSAKENRYFARCVKDVE